MQENGAQALRLQDPDPEYCNIAALQSRGGKEPL